MASHSVSLARKLLPPMISWVMRIYDHLLSFSHICEKTKKSLRWHRNIYMLKSIENMGFQTSFVWRLVRSLDISLVGVMWLWHDWPIINGPLNFATWDPNTGRQCGTGLMRTREMKRKLSATSITLQYIRAPQLQKGLTTYLFRHSE